MCVYICIHIYVCVYMNTWTHTYTYTHTNMHIPAHTHVIHWKQVGEFEEAEQMYRRAMGTARDAAEHMVTTCHNFGILKVEMGQTERAGELLKKALLVDPFHIPSCLTYGRLLLETKVPLSPSSL